MNKKIKTIAVTLVALTIFVSLMSGAAAAQLGDGIGDGVSDDTGVGDNVRDNADDLRDEAEDTRDEASDTADDLRDEAQDATNEAENTTSELVTNVDVEGAAFVAPESIQNEVDSLRRTVPDGTASHAFVLASSDQLYIVLTDEEPREGYATVQGTSLDRSGISLSSNHQTNLDLEPIRATDVEFQEPSQASVEEVYQNTDAYNREYVEFDANHRSIAVDYEETDYAATAGVLIDDPVSPSELFGAVGEQSYTTVSNFEAANVGSVLGDISQPHVVTTSYETEYWENTGVTMSGIIASPSSTAADFIESQQQNEILPTDSSTPILYIVDKQYETRSVSSISEVSENPSEYDGETVRFEANLYMTTLSSKRVAESATGTALPPVDTVLHGGVTWDQLPENRDDLTTVMAASSIEQTQIARDRSGVYEITGEVISTERLDGEYPQSSILVAYDLERKGPINTASVEDLIESESSSVSSMLEQQANPEVEISAVSTPVEETDNSAPEETTEQSPDEASESSSTNPNTEEESGAADNQSDPEQDNESETSGGITKAVVDLLSSLFGTAQPATHV